MPDTAPRSTILRPQDPENRINRSEATPGLELGELFGIGETATGNQLLSRR